jgi:predicted  nucleic acid-binding Zn-ribbon protein
MTKRDEYVQKTKAQLDQWNAEIDKMQAKMREAEADSKIRYQKRLEEMRKRRDEATEQLIKMQKAGDQAWDDLRSGFEKSWEQIQSAFRDATSRFK